MPDLSDLGTPATPPPPSQAAGGGIDLSDLGTPVSPQPQPQPSFIDLVKSAVVGTPEVQAGIGAVKGAEKTAAGIIDLARQEYLGAKPGEQPSAASTVAAAAMPGASVTQALPESVKSPVRDAAQTAADWLRRNTDTQGGYQKVGDIGESVAELMAMPEIDAEAMGSKAAMSLGDHLSQAGKITKFLENNKKLAAVVRAGLDATKAATRSGAEMGAQTYVKTGGDTEAATQAAAEGAAVGGVVGGGSSLYRTGREALSKAASEALGTRAVAGAEFPVTAEGGLRAPELKPGIVDPATAPVDEATGNIGKTAVYNSLSRSNAAARAREAIPESNPARMLPAPAEHTPGFTVGAAAEPTPVREGTSAFDPGKQQIGTRAVEGKGPGQFDLPQYSPELADAASQRAAEQGTLGAPNPQPEPSGSHKEPVFQYRNAVRPGTENPVAETSSGPGTLILTSDGNASSVERARAQLAQYDRILNDDEITGEMGVRQYRAIQDAHADLSEQLRRYDDFAASQPHFPLHDVREAIRSTDSLGAAAEQIKAANAPFWQKADAVSNGEFRNLREQEKFLQKKLYSPSPVGNLEDLKQQLADNQQKQMDFFDKYRTDVSPEEWKTHREGYQDGIVLGNLHNLIEGKFNGVTRADAAASSNLQRVFKPGQSLNQQLEDFYNTKTNREVLERTIGANHMRDLKEIGQLFENPDRQAATKGLLDSIGSAIRRHHYGIGGIAGGIAYGASHSLGTALGLAGAGALGSGAVTGTMRYITDRIATDPKFARQFIYAAKNGVSTRIAAPLLASTLLRTTESQQPQGAKPNGGN